MFFPSLVVMMRDGHPALLIMLWICLCLMISRCRTRALRIMEIRIKAISIWVRCPVHKSIVIPTACLEVVDRTERDLTVLYRRNEELQSVWIRRDHFDRENWATIGNAFQWWTSWIMTCSGCRAIASRPKMLRGKGNESSFTRRSLRLGVGNNAR